LFHVSMMTPKNDRSSGHCDLNKIAVFIVNRGLVNGYNRGVMRKLWTPMSYSVAMELSQRKNVQSIVRR
ncbi:hypothetical protein, partial [Shewanella surugensis]